MYCNSSKQWHQHRHRGNGWIVPLVILGLIILTHGWILFLPLMALAGFALVGLILPRAMWHMKQGDWQNRDWSSWADEKRKRHFQNWEDGRYDEKPKRDSRDDIEYV